MLKNRQAIIEREPGSWNEREQRFARQNPPIPDHVLNSVIAQRQPAQPVRVQVQKMTKQDEQKEAAREQRKEKKSEIEKLSKLTKKQLRDYFQSQIDEDESDEE